MLALGHDLKAADKLKVLICIIIIKTRTKLEL